MDFLKHSLQEAGKMDPDKPVFEKYEKEILLEIGKKYLSQSASAAIYNILISASFPHWLNASNVGQLTLKRVLL